MSHLPNDPALTDWRDTLEWARSKLILPQFVLRIEIADYDHEKLVPKSRLRLDLDGYKNIIKGYLTTLRTLELLQEADATSAQQQLRQATNPLRPGNGLRHLFIHLANPFYWRGKYAPHSWRERTDKQWQRLQLEQMIERLIMGAEYDSEKGGEKKHKISRVEMEISAQQY